MAELIPEMQVSAFRKLNVEQIKMLKSCEIVAEGEYIGTWVNGNLEDSGFLRKSTEDKCQAANAVRGLNPEEVLKMFSERPKLVRKPKARKKRRQAVPV
jgi:hypothetical protein